MDFLRSQPRLLHTILVLLLWFGVSTGLHSAQANVLTLDGGIAYLNADDTEVRVRGEVSLHPQPNTQYGTIRIILEDTNARITHLSAAIARHAQITLPHSDQYAYSFNANTARVEIRHAGALMLSLPLDSQGQTPLVRIGEQRFVQIRVNTNGEVDTSTLPSYSQFTLHPPVIPPALLSGVEYMFQPQITYGGTGIVEVQITQGPDNMSIDSRSGLISWVPRSDHEGQNIRVSLSATDGDLRTDTSFDLAVITPTSVQVEVTTDAEQRTRIRVIEDTGGLQGLEVDFPTQQSRQMQIQGSSTDISSNPGVSIIPETAIDASKLPDDVIRITDFFRINPVYGAENNVRISIPLSLLPEGRYPHELALWILAETTESFENQWVPMSVRIADDHDLVDEHVTFYISYTGSESFIGLENIEEDIAARNARLFQASHTDWQRRTIQSLSNPGISYDIQCKKHTYTLLLFKITDHTVDICRATHNSQLRNFHIKGLHDRKNRLALAWKWDGQVQKPDDPAHAVTSWLLDSITKFDELGLRYDVSAESNKLDYDIEVVFKKMNDWGYVTPTNNRRVLYINRNFFRTRTADGSIATVAHEYFHHAQSRTGNVLSGNERRKRLWLYEGTAVWFEDEVFDNVSSYEFTFCSHTPNVAFEGVSTPPIEPKTCNLGDSSEYERYAFFKLLDRSSSNDRYGCNFRAGDGFLRELFTGHEEGNDGGQRLTEVLENPQFACYFGDSLGSERSSTIAAALNLYHETYLRFNSGETDLATRFDHNDELKFGETGNADLWFTSTVNHFTLPPLSARSFRVKSNTGTGIPVIRVNVQGGDAKKAFISVRSLSPYQYHGYKLLDTSPTEFIIHDTSIDEYHVTVVNSSPGSDLEIEAIAASIAPPTIIPGRYQPIEDGSIIRDITTGLEWQRCSVGQTWNAVMRSCDGEASLFNWEDAMQLTAPGGFKTPDITELRSLVYCSTGQPQEFRMEMDRRVCDGNYQRPAIVTEAFPNTPADGFWSSTPDAGHGSHHAWYVFFGSGFVNSHDKDIRFQVRLVRISGEVDHPLPELNLNAGDGQITAFWNETQGHTYNLFISSEANCDVTNYTSCANGQMFAGVSSGYTIDTLQNGLNYYVILQVEVEGLSRIMLTKAVAATPQPTQPSPATGRLNDTGIDWCADDYSRNLRCPVPSHLGQDGDYGRDAQAHAGHLQKIGSGTAGFDFTKLDINGQPLIIQNAAWRDDGNEFDGTRWSCVRDNHTGLIWEVKANDSNDLRHRGHTYSWYDPNSADGYPGAVHLGNCTGSDCDTYSFVQTVNAQRLCGSADWRIPTLTELRGIVNFGTRYPAIDRDYFPNTLPSVSFWSSLSVAHTSSKAWGIDSYYGGSTQIFKNNRRASIRLVSDGQ